jgi:hypothetical protein
MKRSLTGSSGGAASKNPLMKARYADLAWDLEKAIANIQPNYQCALMAVDGHVEVTVRAEVPPRR